MLTAFNAGMSVIQLKQVFMCMVCLERNVAIEVELGAYQQLNIACLQHLSGFAICSIKCMLMGRALHIDWMHAHGIVKMAIYHNVCSWYREMAAQPDVRD